VSILPPPLRMRSRVRCVQSGAEARYTAAFVFPLLRLPAEGAKRGLSRYSNVSLQQQSEADS
jgi:hypothetical protein